MSADVLRIGCLPAGHGDCVLVEYGPSGDRTRVLLDAGPANAYKSVRAALARLKPDQRRFARLIPSHVDTDHIDGAILLLQDDKLGLEFDDVWFNGWHNSHGSTASRPTCLRPHRESSSGRSSPSAASRGTRRDPTRPHQLGVCDRRHGAPSLGVHDRPPLRRNSRNVNVRRPR